jgi:hypothetical protein
MIAELVLLQMLRVTGITGEMVEINPDQIASLRVPSALMQEGHFHGKAKCVIFTGDGKFIATLETCKQILDRLGQ